MSDRSLMMEYDSSYFLLERCYFSREIVPIFFGKLYFGISLIEHVTFLSSSFDFAEKNILLTRKAIFEIYFIKVNYKVDKKFE